MPNQSTPDDLLRFVHLRHATPPVEEEIEFRLIDTGFSRKLSAGPRSDRGAIAQTWLTSTGREIIDGLGSNELFGRILGALEAARAEAEPRTVRTFLRLISGFESISASARRTLAEALSDLLLASLYSPRVHVLELPQIEAVFRGLVLLDAAANQGVTVRRDTIDGPAEILDHDLDRSLGRGLLLPLEWDGFDASRFGIGIADLLVVKQHIKAYEPGEIAHIENVMASEKRDRTHRTLDRMDQEFTTELETEVEKTTELETAERFELSNEISRTVKEDQQFGLGLSLSASYGPIAVSSNLQFERRESSEDVTQSATSYAKDVVDRSMERVRERVRRQQITRILNEVEETNLHSFTNSSNEHIVGIYQFADKVYEAQVFNYGKREMFDLMIPEPASYLAFLEPGPSSSDDDLLKPTPPPPIDFDAFDITYADPEATDHFAVLAARYGATGLTPPPPLTLVDSLPYHHPETGSQDEAGHPTNVGKLEVKVPSGYGARKLEIAPTTMSDRGVEGGLIVWSSEGTSERWAPDATSSHDAWFQPREGAEFEEKVTAIELTDVFGRANEGLLTIGFVARETANYAFTLRVTLERTAEALDEWRLKTFDRLQAAFDVRMLEYKEALAQYHQAVKDRARREEAANEERIRGTPPSRQNEIIIDELKKHAIAFITEDFFTRNDTPRVVIEGAGPAGSPTFDRTEAVERGSFVRFIEQAFEWEQMQYVFYPYFWARSQTWEDRFAAKVPGYQFRRFLQAGWARVVVPVRPGFEASLHYYLETGHVWSGRGAPPAVGDDMYISIADEMRYRTEELAASAVAQGTPWDIRVPTALVLLRRDEGLPRWERLIPDPGEENPDLWNWQLVEEPSGHDNTAGGRRVGPP